MGMDYTIRCCGGCCGRLLCVVRLPGLLRDDLPGEVQVQAQECRNQAQYTGHAGRGDLLFMRPSASRKNMTLRFESGRKCYFCRAVS